MKAVITTGLLALIVMVFACAGHPADTQSPGGFVVIELFTSQGCSSCPPAEKLLAETMKEAAQHGKRIYAMEFHVDYWNRLGWSDPFSNSKYSARQNAYAARISPGNIYTPQMVVNGSSAFVGSSRSDLQTVLTQALNQTAAVTFSQLTFIPDVNGALKVHFELKGEYQNCTINMVLVSKTETTEIKRGENGGRTLVNSNVVRQFITEPASQSGNCTFSPPGIPGKNNRAVIAFIQAADMKITGADAVE